MTSSEQRYFGAVYDFTMSKTATLLLTHKPDDERLNEIVSDIVMTYGANYGSVSFFVSDEVPPAGYGVDVRDQLEAHHRDTPGSVFLTVLMEGDLA